MKKAISDQLEELRRENIELRREIREREKWRKLNNWTQIAFAGILIIIISIGLIRTALG